MPYWAVPVRVPRQPGGEQFPSPAQVVCFVNHRLTVSSLVSSPVVPGHTHTLAHSYTRTPHCQDRRTYTHISFIESYRGATPAQPLGLYSGHSGRSRASRTLSAGLVLASLKSSPPLPPRQCHRHRHTATPPPPPPPPAAASPACEVRVVCLLAPG